MCAPRRVGPPYTGGREGVCRTPTHLPALSPRIHITVITQNPAKSPIALWASSPGYSIQLLRLALGGERQGQTYQISWMYLGNDGAGCLSPEEGNDEKGGAGVECPKDRADNLHPTPEDCVFVHRLLFAVYGPQGSNHDDYVSKAFIRTTGARVS